MCVFSHTLNEFCLETDSCRLQVFEARKDELSLWYLRVELLLVRSRKCMCRIAPSKVKNPRGK